jgi:hypothetical protein
MRRKQGFRMCLAFASEGNVISLTYTDAAKRPSIGTVEEEFCPSESRHANGRAAGHDFLAIFTRIGREKP